MQQAQAIHYCLSDYILGHECRRSNKGYLLFYMWDRYEGLVASGEGRGGKSGYSDAGNTAFSDLKYMGTAGPKLQIAILHPLTINFNCT